MFDHCDVKDVIVVVLPNERTAIHLDMIFTQLDRELCCVYPPHFVGPERLAVLHRRKKSKGVKEMPNFFAAMQAVDHPLEPRQPCVQTPLDARQRDNHDRDVEQEHERCRADGDERPAAALGGSLHGPGS